MLQVTNSLVMVRPSDFRMNEQTAINNFFQENTTLTDQEVDQKAKEQFDAFVIKLQKHGVEVVVLNSQKDKDTPDAVFPNNWISFHQDGTIGVYPMFAENRRQERRTDVFDVLEEKGYVISGIVDYTEAEDESIFLEGTGSIILDRVHKKAYCALSERADEDLFIEFCEDFDYFPVLFHAYQNVENKRALIYHTNVMMAIAETFAIICLNAIDDKKERKFVISQLKESGKEIIEISEPQMHQFAGNMLQVMGNANQRYLVMSEAAYLSLTSKQLSRVEEHCKIIYSPLDIIEKLGGGSARCMMAENFLPKRA